MRWIIIFLFTIFTGPWSAAQDSAVLAKRFISTGNSCLNDFKPIESMAYYLRALDIGKKIGNRSVQAEALLGAGQSAWYRGRFHNAADTVQLAIKNFDPHQRSDIVTATRILSNIYDDMGNYEQAFQWIEKALAQLDQLRDEENQILSLIQMGKLYKNIGDFDASLRYYQKAAAYHSPKGGYPYRELNHCLGELYIARKIYDSATFYYRNAMVGNPRSRIIRLRLGEYYLMIDQPDSAYSYLQPLYEEARALGDVAVTPASMISLGRIAMIRHQIPEAIELARNAFEISAGTSIMEYKTKALELLVSLYENSDPRKALYYQRYFDRLRDSSISDVFKGQLYAFKQREQLASQSGAIHKLQAEKKIAGAVIIIVVLLAIFILSIVLLRHKNERLALKQQAAELQMQALRSQMNPHFIFNCLSAINHFVLKGETNLASEYLTRFSRLIRLVLINADKPSITLEEELNILHLYLDMEQLRFKDSFSYNITIGAGIHPSTVMVPSFILQPFCENAIWHGLLHKEGKGLLEIDLSREGDTLIFQIRDNGVGIEQATRLKSKDTGKNESLGQKLGAGRLNLFNGDKENMNSFSISELKDENGGSGGTVVTLKIKLKDADD